MYLLNQSYTVVSFNGLLLPQSIRFSNSITNTCIVLSFFNKLVKVYCLQYIFTEIMTRLRTNKLQKLRQRTRNIWTQIMFAIKPQILGIILILDALIVFFLGLTSSHVHAIVFAQQSSIDWRDITHTIIEVPVTIGYLVGGIALVLLKQWAKLLVLVSVSISLIFTIIVFLLL